MLGPQPHGQLESDYELLIEILYQKYLILHKYKQMDFRFLGQYILKFSLVLKTELK